MHKIYSSAFHAKLMSYKQVARRKSRLRRSVLIEMPISSLPWNTQVRWASPQRLLSQTISCLYVFTPSAHITINFFLGGGEWNSHPFKAISNNGRQGLQGQWILLNTSSVVFGETHNDPDLYFVFCETDLLCPYHMEMVSVKVWD